MKKTEFKTNINCAACVAKVTPAINQVIGSGHWNVNTSDPKKILTVEGNEISDEELINAIQQAGYSATKL
ncbi:MAG: heavy-metal-associated domain-containing protein [Ferruginibacter sp.]